MHIGKEVQKPLVSTGVLWVLSFAIERKYPVGDKKEKLLGKLPPEAKQKRLSENFPSKVKKMNQLNRFMARSGPCEINTSAASPARSSASISTF